MTGTRQRWAPRHCVVTAASALLLALVSSSQADEPPYPVWWSPVLELESLADIDARLERDIWLHDSEGFPLYKKVEGVRVKVWAKNCNDMLALTEAGYYGGDNPMYNVQLLTIAYCRALVWLKQAAPAEQSHIREFALDETAVPYLPALIYVIPSCDFFSEFQQANEQRSPIATVMPDIEVTITEAGDLALSRYGGVSLHSVLARGDMNSDGLEDLLVLSGAYSTQGTGSWSYIFLLTRETTESVLYVLKTQEDYCLE